MFRDAVLKFVKANGDTSEIRVSTGENIATHNGVLTLDYQGYNGDKDYLLAPFDCIVRAIDRYNNQVLFESTETVMTVDYGAQSCVCIHPTHMDDEDFNTLGIKVGKRFKRGEVIYREGTKGMADGNHIHMSQALGGYEGGSPSVDLPGVFYEYKDKWYQQKQINSAHEVSAYDLFFAGCPVDLENGGSDVAKEYIWTSTSENLVPPAMETKKIECIKASMSSGYYPTRDSYNGNYSPNSFLIAVGDVLNVSEIKHDGTHVVCKIETVQRGGETQPESNELRGRWFAYDTLNFD